MTKATWTRPCHAAIQVKFDIQSALGHGARNRRFMRSAGHGIRPSPLHGPRDTEPPAKPAVHPPAHRSHKCRGPAPCIMLPPHSSDAGTDVVGGGQRERGRRRAQGRVPQGTLVVAAQRAPCRDPTRRRPPRSPAPWRAGARGCLESLPLSNPVRRGLLFGLGLLVAEAELATPARPTAPPGRHPWQAHARGLVAHLAYGPATNVISGAVNESRRFTATR